MSLISDIIQEFPAVSPENWKSIFLKETKQDNFQPHHSYLGIDFMPVYAPGKNYTEQAKLLQKLSPVDNEGWKITRSFELKNNVAGTNKKILEALAQGNSALLLQGELQQPDVLLKDVLAEYIEINLQSPNPNDTLRVYLDWCKQKNISANITGALYHDPIGHALLNGGWNVNREKDLELLFDNWKMVANDAPQFKTIAVDVSVYHYAGANLVQTISCALLHATEYLNYFKSKGADLLQVIDRMVFIWPVGISFFAEVSAIRAFRLLWNNICQHITGKDQLYPATIHAQTSLHFWSVADIYNNMLRATTQAMAAVTAGANSLYVHSYNVVSTSANDFSERMATNVQLLLREEAFMGKVADPAGGAQLVEELTAVLASEALNLFKTTEAAGGLLQWGQQGELQERLAQNLASTKEAVKKGEIKILGANLYPNKNEQIATIPKKDLFIKAPSGKDFKPLQQQRLATVLEN